MTFRQKCKRQTLLTNRSKNLYEFYSSFESFYKFYLQCIEEYESLDDIPYPKREKLLRLCNIYHQADLSYRKSLRDIYNFDKIVSDEEKEYQLSLMDDKLDSSVALGFKKRRLGSKYE